MYKLTGGNTLIKADAIMRHARIGDGNIVADLGCGATGYFVFMAARLVGKRGKVYAVDIQKTILETVARRVKVEQLSNIEIVWSNLEIFNATKIEPASLDVGLLINTLYQSRKRAEIMRESIRLIKKDGRLVVVEWENTSLPFGPPAAERVNEQNLTAAAPKLGLALTEEFTAGPCHYGLVFSKI